MHGGPKCIFNIVIAATAIICSPRRSFRDLATPLRRAPLTSHEATLDEQLFQSMISSVRMWNADAAADEQLAAREAAIASSDCCRPLFKNLEFVNRDVAHSSRRLRPDHFASHHVSHTFSISAHEPDHNPNVSQPRPPVHPALVFCLFITCTICRVCKRPWFADDYLKETYLALIYRKSSITCMVQNSDLFKQWFSEYQKHATTRTLKTGARDLGLAKHRFDSSSRPLAYFCLTFESLIMTACRIMVERPNKIEEANAEMFLRSLHLVVCLRLLAIAIP